MTFTKNALSQAQHYIESLVGAGTVLAVTPLALQQYDQYSPSQAGLTVGVDAAHETLENLEQIISLETIAERVLTEELQRALQAYQRLLRTIAQKRQS